MAKLRIFQIAKELNISHTDIVSFLTSKKIEVSSHMSPVDESVHQMIMAEFAKDREQVERFRKEQVRKEIHVVKLKKQQESSKKLQLLSLTEQRQLEQAENKKKEELRKICFNKNNNEVLVQGRGPYSYSINIDEADDETIMKLKKLGS